jgi:hypothetical protein
MTDTQNPRSESTIKLESHIRFSEPRQRYQNGGGWIDLNQAEAECREHDEARRTWEHAAIELKRLQGLIPPGYRETSLSPFGMSNGDIIVRVIAREDEDA